MFKTHWEDYTSYGEAEVVWKLLYRVATFTYSIIGLNVNILPSSYS